MFSFNLYSSLLLPAVIQCMLFAGLAFWRYIKEKRLSDLFLSLILLVCGFKISFWMLGFAGWYDSHDAYTSFMFYFPFSAYLLAGPLIYFYFRSLTDSQFSLSAKDRPHLILPILFSVLIIWKAIADFGWHYPFPDMPDYQFGTRGPYAEADKSTFVTMIGFLSFFFYLFLTLKSFPAYRRYLQDNLSSFEEVDFSWLRNMLFMLTLGVTVLLIFKLWEILLGGISYKTDWFSYLALSAVSYFIADKGYHIRPRRLNQLHFQQEPGEIINVLQEHETSIQEDGLDIESCGVADGPSETAENKGNTGDAPGPAADILKMAAAIDLLMKTQKPFLQYDLTLDSLSKMLGSNKSVVSKAVNTYYRENFNDFINRYRVNEVISLIGQGKDQDFTLISIAYECGFNSKATFNRAFKKVTGLTPGQFIDRRGNPLE